MAVEEMRTWHVHFLYHVPVPTQFLTVFLVRVHQATETSQLPEYRSAVTMHRVDHNLTSALDEAIIDFMFVSKVLSDHFRLQCGKRLPGLCAFVVNLKLVALALPE